MDERTIKRCYLAMLALYSLSALLAIIDGDVSEVFGWGSAIVVATAWHKLAQEA